MKKDKTTYIALLRGINVGGKNLIKMNKLKTSFVQMGFGDVRTHIQSGKVVFTANKQNLQSLEAKIEPRSQKHLVTRPAWSLLSAQHFCRLWKERLVDLAKNQKSIGMMFFF